MKKLCLVVILLAAAAAAAGKVPGIRHGTPDNPEQSRDAFTLPGNALQRF
ncbi:hypothetical protein [Taibaiella helva]|nr:hypothetical protein [Taibaiella helva]